jgi:hypothetical protein
MTDFVCHKNLFIFWNVEAKKILCGQEKSVVEPRLELQTTPLNLHLH